MMKTLQFHGRLALLVASVLMYSPVWAKRQVAPPLPPEVVQAFAAADVPLSHVSLLARPVGQPNRVAWRSDVAMNPASTMKLLTTFAGLELLGPGYRWNTSVFRQGEVVDGVLRGNLWIRGGGDPRLTLEQMWLLLRQIKLRGVRRVEGDILLDRSLWQLPPAEVFDDTPLKPYNVTPDPLLSNFKTVRFRFLPNGSQVQVLADPPLPELQLLNRVVLDSQPCGDWKNGLQVEVQEPNRVSFSGRYHASCGERDYYISLLSHADYSAALIGYLWHDMGGELTGRVREAPLPAGSTPWFEHSSAPLAEVIRDINKFSNNTQARLLYIALGGNPTAAGADPLPAAESAVRDWLLRRGVATSGLVLENGSGLSRKERVSAATLADLLDLAQNSPLAPEFESSLPIVALDGTMKKRLQDKNAAGKAHIKTGSLEGVRAVAGYVQRRDGKWIVVGMVNHPRAGQVVDALDRWIDWVAGAEMANLAAQAE